MIDSTVLDTYLDYKGLALSLERTKAYTFDDIMDRMVHVLGELKGSPAANDMAKIPAEWPDAKKPLTFGDVASSYRDHDARSGKALSASQVSAQPFHTRFAFLLHLLTCFIVLYL